MTNQDFSDWYGPWIVYFDRGRYPLIREFFPELVIGDEITLRLGYELIKKGGQLTYEFNTGVDVTNPKADREARSLFHVNLVNNVDKEGRVSTTLNDVSLDEYISHFNW